MKRKIPMLFMAMLLVVTVLTLLGPYSHAEVVLDSPDYLFDDYSYTDDGVTITIDNATQTVTLDGTATSIAIFDTDTIDLFTENTGGYDLDVTKDYLLKLEYVSGSATFSSSYSLYFHGGTFSSAVNNYYGTALNDTNYTETKWAYFSASDFDTDGSFEFIRLGSGSVATALKYKISIFEIDTTASDIATVFTADDSYTGDNLTISHTDNQITITGATSVTDVSYDVSAELDASHITDSDTALYLVKMVYVSGTLSSSTFTGFQPFINGVLVADDTAYDMNFGRIYTGEELLTDWSIWLHSAATYTLTYTDLIYDIQIEEIVASAQADVNVSYYVDGSLDETVTVSYGTAATEPNDPVLSGYTFVGWYDAATDGTLFDFNATLLTEDISLYAYFVEDTATTYTVTFDSNEGTQLDDRTVVSGETVQEPTDPTKTGYSFAGWFTDAELTTVYDFETVVTEDFTLYAKWVESTPVDSVPGASNDTALIIGLSVTGAIVLISGYVFIFGKKR